MSSAQPEHGCELQADCAAYVLGALTDHEFEAHTEHLAECAICRAEVAQLQPVADSLAVGVPLAKADRSLRVRVLGAGRAEVELGARGPAVDAPTATPAGRPSRASGRSTGSGRATLRPVIPRRPLQGLAGALALGVGVALGALVFSSFECAHRGDPRGRCRSRLPRHSGAA